MADKGHPMPSGNIGAPPEEGAKAVQHKLTVMPVKTSKNALTAPIP